MSENPDSQPPKNEKSSRWLEVTVIILLTLYAAFVFLSLIGVSVALF